MKCLIVRLILACLYALRDDCACCRRPLWWPQDFASNVMGLCSPPSLPPTGPPVIVDVGAGVGGPARFLAHDYGCRVLALEYNKELCRAGKLYIAYGL